MRISFFSLNALVGILGFSLLTFFSCKNNLENKPEKKITQKSYSVVKPPFKNIDIAFSSFTINPQVDNFIVTETGTKIEVKANSLQDENGLPLKDDCVLKYREFMSPSEILVSGIPMTFKDKAANLNENFVSAGMFEIKAEHPNCKRVSINPDSPLRVKLATNVKGEEYSNFYLNTTTGEWIYSGQGRMYPNSEKLTLNVQIDKLKRKASMLGKDYVSLNSEALMDAYLNEDYERIYKFFQSKNPRIPKKVRDYGVKDIGVFSNQYILHNGIERPASMWLWENVDHAKFPIWNTSYYAKFDSLNKDLYLVSVLNYPNDSLIFQSKLKVVMALSHLFKFQPEYLKDKWEEAMKEISKQEQTLVKMRDMYREFQVNSFGIYNSDKFYKNPESFEVIAQFDFPYNNQKLKPEKLYYVSAKEKFLISYTLSANTRFMYNGDESARLYTILNENFLAEVEPSQLINLKGRKGELTEARLKFKIKRKINSATDLKREIGI